jgi:hypothetical protein
MQDFAHYVGTVQTSSEDKQAHCETIPRNKKEDNYLTLPGFRKYCGSTAGTRKYTNSTGSVVASNQVLRAEACSVSLYNILLRNPDGRDGWIRMLPCDLLKNVVEYSGNTLPTVLLLDKNPSIAPNFVSFYWAP